MKTTEKIEKIENVLGGPSAAARAAGVTYVSWYRWKKGGNLEGREDCMAKRIVDLLYEKVMQDVQQTTVS